MAKVRILAIFQACHQIQTVIIKLHASITNNNFNIIIIMEFITQVAKIQFHNENNLLVEEWK
jgi:hypothetical protein